MPKKLVDPFKIQDSPPSLEFTAQSVLVYPTNSTQSWLLNKGLLRFYNSSNLIPFGLPFISLYGTSFSSKPQESHFQAT